MAEDSLPSPDFDEMTLTNRGLAALYIQYPDMEEVPGDESAIASDTESEQEGETSGLSNSTTQTTPPRGDVQDAALSLVSSSSEGPFSCFLQRLANSDLPADSCEHLTGLGYAILDLGRALFPPAGPESVTTQVLGEAVAVSRALTAVFKCSCTKVSAQSDNITYILKLAPFTIQLQPADLWANYKQMADLIIEHTRLPTHQEQNLLNDLINVYDAYVYHPALSVYRDQRQFGDLQRSLDGLYNTLLTLEQRYRHWWNDVKELGKKYTKPTLRHILDSPSLLQHIQSFEALKDAAEAAESNADSQDRHRAARKLLQRQQRPASSKSIFRREHTL